MNLMAHKAAIFTQVAGDFILFGTADCLITQSELGFQQDSAVFDQHKISSQRVSLFTSS